MSNGDPRWWTGTTGNMDGTWRLVDATILGWRVVATCEHDATTRAAWKVYIDTDMTKTDLIHIGDTRPSHDPPTRKIVADMLRRWVVRTMGKAANVLDALETG